MNIKSLLIGSAAALFVANSALAGSLSTETPSINKFSVTAPEPRSMSVTVPEPRNMSVTGAKPESMSTTAQSRDFTATANSRDFSTEDLDFIGPRLPTENL